MKRSLLTVLAASSLLVLGACAQEDEADELDTVQEIETPAPAPAPVPMDTMPMDTMATDTMAPTTTTGM